MSHDKHINHKNNMLRFRALEKMQLSNKWVLVFASHGKHINHIIDVLMFRTLQQCVGLLMCAQQWEHAVLHVVKSVRKMVTDSLGETLLRIDLHGFIDVLRDQRHWS